MDENTTAPLWETVARWSDSSGLYIVECNPERTLMRTSYDEARTDSIIQGLKRAAYLDGTESAIESGSFITPDTDDVDSWEIVGGLTRIGDTLAFAGEASELVFIDGRAYLTHDL